MERLPRPFFFLFFSILCSVLSFSSSVLANTRLDYEILEELSTGTVVGNLATDSHLSKKYLPAILESLRFEFIQPDTSGHQEYFSIVEETGQLTIGNKTMDREEICPVDSDSDCLLQLNIGVKPTLYFEVMKVNVKILDVNDHAPKFRQDTVDLSISEMTAPGTEFAIPEADDPDSGVNGIKKYSLLPVKPEAEAAGLFDLRSEKRLDGSTNLRFVVVKKLDRERMNRYGLKVLASDGGIPEARTGTLLLDVIVVDVNDNSPRFVEPVYDISIEENLNNGTIIGVVEATDADEGDNAKVFYEFARNTRHAFGNVFRIDSASGQICVIGPVDFERRDRYSLGVVAQDQGSNPLSTLVMVNIHVVDVNDNPPIISVNPLTSSGIPEVLENARIGTFAAHVSVSDPDSGDGGRWNCSLLGSGFRLQAIPDTNGFKLITSSFFDRENVEEYHVTLECADRGHPSLTSSAQIQIRVLDENDEDPTFHRNEYLAAVRENNEVGDYVTQVQAIDRDLGRNGEISYRISQDETSGPHPLVSIDPKLGRIYAAVKFDREVKTRHEIVVIATDGGQPTRSAVVTLRLDVDDVNDESPRFSNRLYTFGTYENQPNGTEIGSVFAIDADAPPHDEIRYSIKNTTSVSAGSNFRIDSATGRITSLTSLDRESVPVYHVTVTACNPGTSICGETEIKIIVADRNDNPPKILFPVEVDSIVQISSRSAVGHVVATIVATDADVGSNAALRYVARSGNEAGLFTLNLLSGVITVRRDLSDKVDSIVDLILTVHDEGVPQLSTSAPLRISVNSTVSTIAAADNLRASSEYALSTVTIVIVAAAISSIIVVGSIIVLVVLRQNRRREQDESGNEPEADGKLHQATKSNLQDRRSVFNVDNETVFKKKNKNKYKNKNNMNEMTEKKNIENRIQTHFPPKNNVTSDSYRFAQIRNGRIPSPPPLPLLSPPPTPSSNSFTYQAIHPGSLFRRFPPPPLLIRCGSCQKSWNNIRSHTVPLLSGGSAVGRGSLAVEPTSDGGSVTDSGKGPSEDGDYLGLPPPPPPAAAVIACRSEKSCCRVASSSDDQHQLTSSAVHSHHSMTYSLPVEEHGPKNGCQRQTSDYIAPYPREEKPFVIRLHVPGLEPGPTSPQQSPCAAVKIRPVNAGHDSSNINQTKTSNVKDHRPRDDVTWDGYLSDATTTSGSYVLENNSRDEPAAAATCVV